MTKQMTLEELCKKFILDNEISAAETVYQCDRVIGSAYQLIEDICDIVGYMKNDDDSGEDGCR